MVLTFGNDNKNDRQLDIASEEEVGITRQYHHSLITHNVTELTNPDGPRSPAPSRRIGAEEGRIRVASSRSLAQHRVPLLPCRSTSHDWQDTTQGRLSWWDIALMSILTVCRFHN